MRKKITEYALYRWRYVIGYVLASLLVAGVFVFGAVVLPDGLRAEEKSAAITSGSLSYQQFDPANAPSLPYHILQRASFAALDVSQFTIKLPSIILGLLAVIGIFLLMREWFRPNVAYLTGIIAATMPALLFAAQDGTPTIYFITVSVWLLLSATHVSRRHEPSLYWKLLSFVLMGLMLYAPLGLYLVIAVVTTMIFHPHIRMTARGFNPNRIAGGVALAIIILTPLIYSVTSDPEIGLRLLGFPEGEVDIVANATQLFGAIFGTAIVSNQSAAPALLSFGLIAIVIIGSYRFFSVRYTARSYIIWFWTLTMLPLVLLNPQYAAYFIPLTILMIAMGIDALIREWYGMFPRNPYARVFALLPLGVVVVGLVLSSFARYAVTYNHTPSYANQFDNDTKLLGEAVSTANGMTDKKVHVVVDGEELPFYQLVQRYREDDFVLNQSLQAPTPLIIKGDYSARDTISGVPERIFTSRASEDADRFYLYTSLSK